MDQHLEYAAGPIGSVICLNRARELKQTASRYQHSFLSQNKMRRVSWGLIGSLTPFFYTAIVPKLSKNIIDNENHYHLIY
jgi:hypothetical protein